jgi:uncharacterized protein (TIRG00374 family)
MNRFLRRVIVAMLLGVLVYGVAVFYAGINTMRESLSTFAWWTFAAALGLASTNYVLRFLKWQYYLRRLGISGIKPLDSFLVFLSGFVLTVTPGKVGEVFKSAVLAKTHGVPAARTAPIVVAERLTDAIGVIVLIVIGSAAYAGGLEWAIAGAFAVTLGLLFIVWERPVRAIIAALAKRPGKLGKLAPKLAEAYGSLRIVAGPAALLWPTFLSILGWGCEGFALFLLLRGFHQTVPLGVAVFFYATATLAGALVPVPGGLGVAEAMIQEQLVRLGGVAQGAATASMIMIRFATLWWAVLVGFGALFVLRVRFGAALSEVQTGAPEEA